MFPKGFLDFEEWIKKMELNFNDFEFYDLEGSVEDNKLLGDAAAFLRLVENRRRKQLKFERRMTNEQTSKYE